MTLFRAKSGGDFTENELEILGILAEHLELCMRRDSLYADGQKVDYELQLQQKLRNMTLTEAEIDIVLLVTENLTNGQIAEMKRIAPATVKKHLSRIYNKIGVVGRGQLQYEINRMMREM